jgi:arylsulfatase A-like enzyme
MKSWITTALCLFTAASAFAEQPNVIFFIADDMLPTHFNCLPQGRGKNLTPNIDRLAGEGVVMLQQYCASPICTPSRYNVLTGTYASRAQNAWFKSITRELGGQTKVEFNTHIIKDQITLPALLKKAGYSTGMVGKNHVVEAHGLKRFKNFDASARDPEIVSQLKANHDRVCQAMREIGFDYADRVYHNNPDFLGLHEVAVQNMEWITEGGINFLKQQGRAPFFLYFATTVPHGPTAEKRSWNADPLISPLGYLKKAPQGQPARSTIPKRLKKAGLPVNDSTANLLWLDDALGALMRTLEESGKLDNTVIFFYSDHGQMSKGTLYQGGIHNPCIIWRKGGFPVGSTSDALTHIVDFAPTILELAQADTAAKFDGRSFLPILNGQEPDDERIMYFELGYARAVRKGTFKYLALRYPEEVENMTSEERQAALAEWNAERRRKHLRIVTEDSTQPFSHLTAIPGGGDAERVSTGAYPGYFDRDQLYDLSRDPREQVNLACHPAYAEKLEEMKTILADHVRDLPGSFGEFGE